MSPAKDQAAARVDAFAYDGLPTRVVHAPGALGTLAQQREIEAAQRIMLLCGPNTARTQLFAQVRSALGQRLKAQRTDIVEHSLASLVEEAAAQVRRDEIDLLVAVGGGSASDTAKAVAILLAEGGSLPDHANVFTPPDHYVQRVLPAPKLPIVVVPTTLSAAEVTPGLGIHDGAGRKLLFWDVKLAPRLIVLDPAACVEVPAHIFATTGMNGVAHCVEGLYSRVRNPISDALAVGGLRMLAQALPRVVADPADVEARGLALVGANLSGQVIANARVGIHHAICHSLGVMGGLSHGVANSIMLPHAVAFNAETVPDRLRVIASALDIEVRGRSDTQVARDTIAALQALQQAAGVPTRLEPAGVPSEALARVAQGTMGDRGLYFNPRRNVTRDEVQALLEGAW